VAESARNVLCSGARPIAITNCLNFGNPMKPEIFWQFRKCVEGMAEGCRVLGTPVTGGNVSFYNENPKGAIDPTPTVGMVGILEDVELRIPSFFQHEGDSIYLLGETFDELGGTQYLLIEHGLRMGLPPRLDLKKELALQNLILGCAHARILSSCHDLSEGGFAVGLSESLLGQVGHPLGAEVEFHFGNNLRRDALLFGETQSRVLVSVSPKRERDLETEAKRCNVPCFKIGRVSREKLRIGSWVDLPSGQIEQTYRNAIPRRMK